MMPRITVKQNDRFFRLLAVSESVTDRHGHRRWLCQCDCGNTTIASSTALHLGRKKSCGCLKMETIGNITRTHGQSTRPTYISWQNMWTRCTNPSYKQYSDYGGRGVIICDSWRSFVNFMVDMGARPDGKSLDRIDPFGNYEPNNCRWATRLEQNRNTRGRVALAQMETK